MIHDRIARHWRLGARRGRGALLAALILFAPLLNLAPPPAAAAAQPAAQYYVATTGHTIGDAFLQRWIDDDGAATLGAPISEVITSTGKTRQYFQYGLLAGNASGEKITRQPAAQLLLSMRVQAHSPLSGRRQTGPLDVNAGRVVAADPQQANVSWDKTTKHVISGDILTYYQSNNGSSRFGRPLTQAYAFGGNTVQWFEFGRIEVNPETRGVSTAPIGFELAHALRIDARKVSQGGMPLFEAARFAKFSGDGTVPEASGVFAPVEIVIPAINVDAKVEQVSIVNGAMGTPQNAWNVGWYPQLAWPGAYSNVVIAGHRDWWGIGPTVFYNLPSLAPGNMIYLISADGKGATYRITAAYSVGSETNANDVVGDTGSEMLTLITCDGSFNGAEYASRQIIRAARI